MHKIRTENIEQKIIPLRKMSIILDRDLAVLYDVETRVLKQAVNRNIQRFPKDFMSQLTENGINVMVSQSVIPSKKYFGGVKPGDEIIVPTLKFIAFINAVSFLWMQISVTI
jgi:hypothetical protein